MILIARGDEHPELPGIRSAEIERIKKILATGRLPTSKEFGVKYARTRELLRQRQSYKCCYCEKFDEEKFTTVEHVRPKSEAKRSNGRVDQDRYWWLAWTWSNLLFSCQQCNNHKGSWYPLRGDDQSPHFGRPLAIERDPPGDETPLLLDPASDDGILHIQFRPIAGRWTPTPREGSLRGYETIKRIKLDRASLLDLYGTIAGELDDGIKRIRREIQLAGQPPAEEVRASWAEVLRRHLRPNAPLAALRYDVLDYAFPKTHRLHWGLSLDEFAGVLTRRRTGA